MTSREIDIKDELLIEKLNIETMQLTSTEGKLITLKPNDKLVLKDKSIVTFKAPAGLKMANVITATGTPALIDIGEIIQVISDVVSNIQEEVAFIKKVFGFFSGIWNAIFHPTKTTATGK